ncbi:MAG TPA: alkaline phosphatase family protein [Thiotrichaceae bacterium]|nr:alkaline phosphatase family protein [Thiotrichaceae bacterium]
MKFIGWANKPLEQASIVGHTTASSCLLWVRTGKIGEFNLLLSKKDPISFSIKDGTGDTITTLSLKELSPNTFYEYSVRDKDNNKIILDGSFKTIPTDQDNKPFSFGFYSCHKPYDKKLTFQKDKNGNVLKDKNGKCMVDKIAIKVENMEVWENFEKTVVNENIRFILGGGDQLYSDGIPGLLDIWQYLRDEMSKDGDELFPSKQDMIEIYRQNYRHYWGSFAKEDKSVNNSIQNIFSTTPMYMTWDDHDILDGFGSYVLKTDDEDPDNNPDDELKFILPQEGKNGQILTWHDRFTLYKRMVSAGKQVYWEYQHSHNPHDEKKSINDPNYPYDYSFEQGTSAFYVLDGRGYRDINLNPRTKGKGTNETNQNGKTKNDVLGDAQWTRFEKWLADQKNSKHEFLFIVSSIPLVHIHPNLANATPKSLGLVQEKREVEGLLDDDLRDCWAWNGHEDERTKLLKALFEVANNGKKVVILSGDVHVASAFQVSDKKSGNSIYQLTASGITFGMSPVVGWAFGATVFTSDAVLSEKLPKDAYEVKPLGFWCSRNYGVIKVVPQESRVEFAVHQKKSEAQHELGEHIDITRLNWKEPDLGTREYTFAEWRNNKQYHYLSYQDESGQCRQYYTNESYSRFIMEPDNTQGPSVFLIQSKYKTWLDAWLSCDGNKIRMTSDKTKATHWKFIWLGESMYMLMDISSGKWLSYESSSDNWNILTTAESDACHYELIPFGHPGSKK